MADKNYKKNFLTRVIARIDFASPLEDFNKRIPKQFDQEALKLFPIKEPPASSLTGTIKFSKNGTKIEEEKIRKIWIFNDKNKYKRLELDLEHLALDVRKYSTYENLKDIFTRLVEILIDEVDELVIKRFGLRYINNIDIDETEPTKWEKFIDKKLLSIFRIPKKDDIVLRAFQNLVLKYNDITLRFRYGMHNPDFPAEIKKKIFVLDLDAFYEGLLEAKEVQNYMDKFHEKIQIMFENSVTNELRKIMGEKNE